MCWESRKLYLSTDHLDGQGKIFLSLVHLRTHTPWATNVFHGKLELRTDDILRAWPFPTQISQQRYWYTFCILQTSDYTTAWLLVDKAVAQYPRYLDGKRQVLDARALDSQDPW